MTTDRENAAAIRAWEAVPRAAIDATSTEGDFAKRHLLNPILLRMLGDVSGRRVLDAGCGNGYLTRMLAARGARAVGVEPAQGMFDYAREKEAGLRQGVEYVRADLARLPDLGGPFDAVVCSMVLMSVPRWRDAMGACVAALRPGGLFVFSVLHPAFEGLWASWRRHGEYRTGRYLAEYRIEQPFGPDFHRPASAYLNELASLGCRLRECAEPGLDPEVAAAAEADTPGISGYVHLPNFLVVAAEAGDG